MYRRIELNDGKIQEDIPRKKMLKDTFFYDERRIILDNS